MDAGIRYMLEMEKRSQDPNLVPDLVAVMFGQHMTDEEKQVEDRCEENWPCEDYPQSKPAPRPGLTHLIRRILNGSRPPHTCECP